MVLRYTNYHLTPLPFKPQTIPQTILGLEWQGKNIENMIGATQVPLGIAGPIKIEGKGNFVVPLATTEAALVASINRGLKALRSATEFKIISRYVGMTRGPVFVAPTMEEAFQAAEKIKTELVPTFKKRLAQLSQHTHLLKIQTQVLGHYLFARFRFDTDEAMGMNMVTYATTALAKIIEAKLNLKLTTVSANFCPDKKFAFANLFFGRGFQVWLEAIIPQEVVTKVLKTNLDDLLTIYQQKIWYGTALAGGLSYNAHIANVLAAFYLATGQDLAHIVENNQSILVMEKNKKGLYFSLFLPSLNIGSYGGGTQLPTQKETIKLILAGLDKNYSGRHAEVLAEVVAAAAAGGELSLLAALSSNTLARAHQKLTGDHHD